MLLLICMHSTSTDLKEICIDGLNWRLFFDSLFTHILIHENLNRKILELQLISNNDIILELLHLILVKLEVACFIFSLVKFKLWMNFKIVFKLTVFYNYYLYIILVCVTFYLGFKIYFLHYQNKIINLPTLFLEE